MSGRLFVLGSFVMACCARVDRLPRAGESLLAAAFSAEPGGKGFNMAVGARRLGAEVDCLAAVGDDLFGRLAEAAFVTADLPPALVCKVADVATGAGIGFIAGDGENCLAVCPGANLALGAADVESHSASIRSARVTLATFELADAPIARAFALARGAGRATLLNPSPFRPVSPEILAVTSMMVVNESECAALATSLGRELGHELGVVEPAGVRALADALFAAGLDVLVVTLGAKGAFAVARDRVLEQAAYPVEALDTLGAGDAFVAGLATSLARGGDLSEALRWGAAAGALTVTVAGTFEALPSVERVESLMGGHQPL